MGYEKKGLRKTELIVARRVLISGLGLVIEGLGHVIEHVVLRVSVQGLLHPLLIEVVTDETNGAAQHEQAVEHT